MIKSLDDTMVPVMTLMLAYPDIVTDLQIVSMIYTHRDVLLSVEYIRFKYCNVMTDIGLVGSLNHVRHIKYLNVAFCTAITDAGIIKIVRMLPNLTSLDVTGTLITDSSLEAIISHSGELVDLNISICYGITMFGIVRMIDVMGGLKSLTCHGTVMI